MKNLVEQLTAEIKKAFENGNYEIAETGNNTFYKVQFDGLPTTLSVFKMEKSCSLLIYFFNAKVQYYDMLPYDLFMEKVAEFEAQNKATQIADLEAKLQALKGGNNE